MQSLFVLKPDAVYDVSGNDPGKPLAQANPVPYALIARAAVALYWGNPFMPWAIFSVSIDDIAKTIFAATRGSPTRYGAYGYILQGKLDQQIDAFLESNKQAGALMGGKWLGELPPVADVEIELDIKKPKKLPKNWIEPIIGTAWAAQIKYWLNSVEQATGVKPWIYTARPQWRFLLDAKGNPPSWTKDYLFWLKFYPSPAEYIDKNMVFPPSALPTGVSIDRVVCWQYFDQGRTYGYDYNDINTMTAAGKALYDVVMPGQPPIDPTPDNPPPAVRTIKKITLEYSDGSIEVKP